jgi:hypothetical protein
MQKVLFLPDGTCKERDASREARGGGRRTFHVFYFKKKTLESMDIVD